MNVKFSIAVPYLNFLESRLCPENDKLIDYSLNSI